MLDNFLRFLGEINFNKIWEDTLKAYPNFPVTSARGDGEKQKGQAMVPPKNGNNP